MSARGWIAVDLDGTLAHYTGWKGATHVGAPIPVMVERVKGWLAEGRDVRIFTARVSSDGTAARDADASAARGAIEGWCIRHLGRELPITNVKDWSMTELWDDRAITVEQNTGRMIGERQGRFKTP